MPNQLLYQVEVKRIGFTAWMHTALGLGFAAEGVPPAQDYGEGKFAERLMLTTSRSFLDLQHGKGAGILTVPTPQQRTLLIMEKLLHDPLLWKADSKWPFANLSFPRIPQDFPTLDHTPWAMGLC